ncbi:hypothetical protein [Nocardia sp. CY41]|uniref:hypothetical protein n=1 Tax=Nocardia sp. CY41 TaxID=2608686 RepID=UPI00135974B3|nr:hypothetical protein [Nocardia sp. CY41]
MVITGAFLADRAEMRDDGKLNVFGGAWAWTSLPLPPANLVLLLDTGPDDVGRVYELVIRMIGPDGLERDILRGDMSIPDRGMFAMMPFGFPTNAGLGWYAFQCRIEGQDALPAVFRLEVRDGQP